MRFYLILLMFSVATVAQAAVLDDSIDEFIDEELATSGTPGLAYVVVDNGQVTTAVRGKILAGSGEPLTTDTPFAIGSVSKSFTALAIMKLAEADQIDLDAPVSQYLDVFSDRPSGIITVRQLLSHTSGYSTKQGNDSHIDQHDGKDELQRQVARIAARSPAHAPESKWQYSNANYLILGALIEKVSEQSFADYVEAEILEPIGMTQSFVADGERHGSMAVGHQPWFGTKRPLEGDKTHLGTAPAGGIIATPSDLGLYLAMMINGEDDLISAESKSAMLAAASNVSPFYGFGWYVDDSNGTAYHSGLIPGIETLAVLSPEDGKGVMVLVNSNSGMGFGDNTGLLYGVSLKAMGDDYNSSSIHWGTRSLYLIFAGLPILFFIGMIQLMFRRKGLMAKTGVGGALSLWFPFAATGAMAWTAVRLIPDMFGVPLKTLSLYQPDFVLLLISTAVTGVIWAVLRIVLFYSGKVSSGDN